MKKLTRVLSALICLALLISVTPVDMLLAAAYADEITGDPVFIEAPAPEPVLAEVPTAEPTEVPAPAATEEPAEEQAPAETEEEQDAQTPDDAGAPDFDDEPDAIPEQTEEPDAIDYTANAGESKAFVLGFAEVLKDKTPVYQDEQVTADVKALLSKGVVYVLGRSDREPDRLEVAFNAGPELGLDGGWVDAARVRPMEPSVEVPAYVAYCENIDNLIYYKDSAGLPLAWIGCAYPEAEPTVAPKQTETAGEPEAPAAEHPVIVTPEPTEMVEADVTPEPDSAEIYAPEDVKLFATINEAGPITLSAKMTYDLKFSVTEGAAYIFSSSDNKVASVTQSGRVTALKAGDATITLKINDDVQDSWNVHIVAAPTFTLKQATVNMAIGDTLALDDSFVITNPEGTPVNYTYGVVSGGSYIKLENGVITGVATGAAKVRVKCHTGAYKDVTVKVYPRAEEIKLGATDMEMGAGQKKKLTVSFPPVGKTTVYAMYELTSNNQEVATVAQDGTITAVAPGNATITATSQDGTLKATCDVVVKAAPTADDLTLTNGTEDGVEALTLGVGEYAQVTVKFLNQTLGGATYSVTKTSAKGVLAINASTGLIRGAKAGTATVTAKLDNSDVTISYQVKVVKAPSAIALTTTTISMGLDDTYQLKEYNAATGEGIIKITAGTHASYSYITGNANVVTFDPDGTLKPVGYGSAKFRVKTHNGKYKDLTVKVLEQAQKINVAASPKEIGSKLSGKVTVSFPDVNGRSAYALYRLKSSNEDALSVAQNGTLTAKEVTEPTLVTITATSIAHEDVVGSCEVWVYPAPNELGFEQKSYEISVGMLITPQLVYPEKTIGSFSYKSGNSKVLAYDQIGRIKGVKVGTTTYTATAQNGVAATVTVYVKGAPVAFDAIPKMVIAVGDTVTLPTPVAYSDTKKLNVTPATYTYISSKAAVAKIVNGNQVTGVTPGTVTIRAKAQNGKYRDFTLQVSGNPITEVYLAHKTMNLYGVGDSLALNGKVIGTDINAGSITYASSDSNIASVSADGIVTAVSNGTATITATASNGVYATCAVTVSALAEDMTLEKSTLVLGEGETYKLVPQFSPEGSGARVTYTSDSASVTVDPDGTVHGVKPGDATVTATSQNKREASVAVTVLYSPTRIALPASVLYMDGGDSVTLRPVLTATVDMAKVNRKLTYNADAINSDIVSVADNGDGSYTVTAKEDAEGTTTLQITTCNGLVAACEIHVGGEESELGFPADWAPEVAMVSGDSADLKLRLNAKAINGDYEVTSDNEGAVKVSADKQSITASAVADQVTLTLKVGGEIVDTRIVQVVASAKPTFKVNSMTGYVAVSGAVDLDVPAYTAKHAKLDILLENLPKKPLIGTFEMSYDTALLAEYDWENQRISTTSKTGTTTVYVKTFSGTASIDATVLDVPVYRALLIGEYNGTPTGNLPFVSLNLKSLESALKKSEIGGQKYETIKVLSNPSEAQIKAGISNTFAGAKRNDVSFIYLVAHGHMSGSTFYFSMYGFSAKKPETYVTDVELMSWIQPIDSNVMLVLCCCHSGGFIDHNKALGNLTSNGHVAVLTAQVASKTAAYVVDAYGVKTHEFFTRSVYTGMGQTSYAGDSWDSAPNADQDKQSGNQDGLITISELCNYADRETKKMAKYYKAAFYPDKSYGFKSPGVTTKDKLNKWFSTNSGEDPQEFIPTAMRNLPIIGY